MLYSCIYPTVFGDVTITYDKDAVTGIKFGSGTAAMPSVPSALSDSAAIELDEYFTGHRREFTIPLRVHGTAFMRSVWDALIDIPYGETRSYKQIAEIIGKPCACRAVGMANNKNPVWIVIPCHRVIGADGSLTGYGGGLEMKERLLRLEGVY